MLLQLSVHDFAIVDRANLEFTTGMTVLTGETGAGKSILIDALSLALGHRASTTVIRGDCERADVTAVFDTTNVPQACDWLIEQHLEDETGMCILRRTIARDGRPRASINARPVPIAMLGEIGRILVDIHGQHAHQSLLISPIQRDLLDDYAGNDDLRATLEDAYLGWRKASLALEELTGPNADVQSRLSLLQYQYDELETLALQNGELEALDEELARLSRVEDLAIGETAVLEQLDSESEPSVLATLERCAGRLREFATHDTQLHTITELVDGAVIQLREATDDLRAHVETLEPDPQRLQQINERLEAITDLARKHQVRPEALQDTFSDIGRQIAEGERTRDQAVTLRAEISRCFSRYGEIAQALTEARKSAAPKLSKAVSDHLQRLGMKGAKLRVEVRNDASRGPAPHGNDKVEFLASTNSGQTPLPMSKIASGGELSRISLALQLLTSDGTGVPTVIFDEVDAGVGGQVAQTIGTELHDLAERRQVLCVTHLPQVASKADNHVLVRKTTSKHSVQTKFVSLTAEERVEEIARMLSGSRLTEQSRAHAQEMLERAPATTS